MKESAFGSLSLTKARLFRDRADNCIWIIPGSRQAGNRCWKNLFYPMRIKRLGLRIHTQALETISHVPLSGDSFHLLDPVSSFSLFAAGGSTAEEVSPPCCWCLRALEVFLFSGLLFHCVCDRSRCFSFLPSEVSLSLKLLISADRLSFVCSVQIVAPPCRPRPFGCGTSLSGGSYSFLVAYCPCANDRWPTVARCGRDCPAASFALLAACPVDV